MLIYMYSSMLEYKNRLWIPAFVTVSVFTLL